MIDRGKFNLLGVEISAVDYEAAVEKVTDAARKQSPFGVSALAVHGVMTGVMDREHRHRLNSLELLVPDGQPVRWGLNWLHGTKLAERVYGPNLMLEICRAAESQGLRICLFGGSAELLDKLAGNLLRQFPNLQIVSRIPSKFRRLEPGEKPALVEQIKNSLSMPIIAVGAAFNFHAGLLRQAPGWMQRFGLEWFYRLMREPLRLWKRYLLLNPYYCFLFACQYLGLRRFDPGNTQAPQGEVLYG
ncbi:MAG: WecB/TagA/CpsF family glycosyltransferase [Pirellulaceae bacterium]